MGEEIIDKTLDIFISYAQEDRNVSMRIYDDLVRSGFSVWRYEKDGAPGVNFWDEINEQLANARIFCLIDSPAARNSYYVAHEITTALARMQAGQLDFLSVCLATPDGDWRNNIAIPFSPQLLPELNRLRYFDFTWTHQEDVFDPFDRYRSAMVQLLESLGRPYVPRTPLPWIENFERELYHKAPLIGNREREILMADYSAFYHYYNIHQTGPAERRLRLIVDDWGHLKLISPLLAMGTLHLERDDLNSSESVFAEITRIAPSNPMGWWGLGIVQFHTNRVEASLDSFNNALQVTDQNNPHHRAVMPNLWNYQLNALISLGKIGEADKTLSAIPPPFLDMPEIKIARVRLLLEKNEEREALKLYETMSYLLETPERNHAGLSQALAELELSFSKWGIRQGNQGMTLFHLENRVRLVPLSIRAWAEYAMFCTVAGMWREKREAMEKGFSLSPVTPEDLYFHGLLYYLQGDSAQADYFRRKSGLHHWGHYSELMD